MADVENKRDFFDDLVKSKYITESYYPRDRTQIIIARKWNSWYPSYFKVDGGCYAILTSDQEISRMKNCGVIVIDPGFRFLEILRKTVNIEPQDIKAVVVTHYHPDHVAGIIEFATLKTASESPCGLFLNKTSYEAYYRIQSKNLSFHQIDSDHTEQLAEYTTYDGTREKIFLTATRAHHEELGHFNNALGVKIEVFRDDEKIFRIGITGDTDGNPNYIREYAQYFLDSDLLIIHLGTFSNKKFGHGAKHLYPRGVNLLLNKIKELSPKPQGKTPRKIAVLSEFGLELGTAEQITNVLRPSIRNLSWRLPLIFAMKLKATGNDSFQQKMHAEMTLEYLRSIDEFCPKTDLDQVILSFGLSVISTDTGAAMRKELARFTKVVDEQLTKTQRRAWELRFSFNKGNELLRLDFSDLAARVGKLISALSEGMKEKSNTEYNKVKDTCELLKHHLLNMIAKPHLSLVIQPVWESIFRYASSLRLFDIPEANWFHDKIRFRKDCILPAALCGLLLLYRNCNMGRSPDSVSTALSDSDNSLLEIGQIFQETHKDWCKILIGDTASRFTFDSSGNALTLTKLGEWVSPWAVEMRYDHNAKRIIYERA